MAVEGLEKPIEGYRSTAYDCLILFRESISFKKRY